MTAASPATGPLIRPAARAELARLQQIERLAGIAFAGIGMDDIATAEVPSVETFAAYLDCGHLWVSAEGETVTAYVMVDIVDGAAHIEQVSVDPAFAHRRIGAQLLDHVEQWSGEHGFDGVTLTTFADVPWNGPYYARCGFRTLGEDELGPELAALREREAAHGLALDQRICMRREPAAGRSY